MKVLLLKDIKGVGKSGDIVNVSEGYARNMLIPSKSASPATDGVIKQVNEKIKINKAKDAKNKAEAEVLAKKISAEKIILSAKVGQNSKLFGAITTQEIAEALNKKYGIAIEKKKINVKDTIKSVGSYHIEVKLYTGVVSEFVLEVIAE